MLIKFADTYLNTSEVARVQMSDQSATIELKNGNVFDVTDGIDYLRTVLDAYHIVNIQKLRSRMPSLEAE